MAIAVPGILALGESPMSPFLILSGILAVFLGIVCGRTCKTMSSGPKEGTRLGGLVVATGIGLLVGVLVACFMPGMWLGVIYGSFGCAALYLAVWTIAERV